MLLISNSFKEIVTERFCAPKLLAFIIPVFYTYNLFQQRQVAQFNNIFYILIFFLFGFIIQVSNNVQNERNVIIPQLNPLKIAFSSLKGIIAIGPMYWVIINAITYVCSIINFPQVTDIILKSIIIIVLSSIFISSFLLFCEKERIIDAYKIHIIFARLGDLIYICINFLIQSAIFNTITCGIIGYTLWLFSGFNDVFKFYITVVAVINLIATVHFISRAYCEGIGYRSSLD